MRNLWKFQTPGVQPKFGRTLPPFDGGQSGATPLRLTGFDLGQGKLRAKHAIFGSIAAFNGGPFQIASVAAPRFRTAVWDNTTGNLPVSTNGSLRLSVTYQEKPVNRNSPTVRANKRVNIFRQLQSYNARTQAEATTAYALNVLSPSQFTGYFRMDTATILAVTGLVARGVLLPARRARRSVRPSHSVRNNSTNRTSAGSRESVGRPSTV